MKVRVMNAKYLILFYTVLISIFIRILKTQIGNLAYFIALFPFVLHFSYYALLWLGSLKIRTGRQNLRVLWLSIIFGVSFLISSLLYGFSSQFISFLYVGFPCLFYLYVRKINVTICTYNHLVSLFVILFCGYIVVEFILYYIDPNKSLLVTNYLKDVVRTVNYWPQRIYYVGLGTQMKPWTPLFSASAGGSFAAVLFAYSFEYRKSHKSLCGFLMVALSLLAIFLSGSKSAYFMFLIYLFIKLNCFVPIRFKNIKLVILFSTGAFALVGAIALWNFYIDTNQLFAIYHAAFFVDPFVHIFNFICQSPFSFIFGAGQNHLLLGTSEVSFFNYIVYYGMLFMFVFLVLMFKAIKQSYQVNNSICIMLIMFIIAMNHYQVTFFLPV